MFRVHGLVGGPGVGVSCVFGLFVFVFLICSSDSVSSVGRFNMSFLVG